MKKITLINEHGIEKYYYDIPDAWHTACAIRDDQIPVNPETRAQRAEDVLVLWHMAHDFRAVLEKRGQARLVSITETGGAA